MIKYFSEEIKFDLKGKTANNKWLRFVVGAEAGKMGDVNIIFCSDTYLLDINMRYLSHDYFTDIITFDYCEGKVVSGDLFISIDSVRDNAAFYKVDFITELRRVMVHGVLHLLGYDDHTPEEQKTMRGKEDYYLDMRKSITGEE